MTRESTIRIRTVEPGDAAAVAGLAAELGYPSDVDTVAASLGRILQHPDHTLLVATEEQLPIGWLHLFINYPAVAEPRAEIAGLVVTEKRRGNGIGGELLEAAKQWARERDLGSLRVRCRTRRHDAHRFYRMNGFTEVKTQQVFSLPLARR